MKVYVAGPYTVGDIACNVAKNIRIGDKLLKLGYTPFVPLLTHFWHILYPNHYDVWMDYDEKWVLSCDVLLRTPGESSGADKEVKLAIAHNIPVVYSVAELLRKYPIDIKGKP